MDDPVRWVTKAEAAEELEISLSTLDRKIRKGEVEVRRDGRRVYVRMEGEYITDEELLRRAIVREDKLERTVRRWSGRSWRWSSERPKWSGSGTRPGKPPPPVGDSMMSWRRRAGRSGQPTGGRGDWPSGSAWPWLCCWSPAVYSSGSW